MPTISEFFGIVITMYYRDHNPPHFHARYAGKKAAINIVTGELIEGKFPPNGLRLVNEWRVLHVQELLNNWEKARNKIQPDLLKPLE